MQPRSPGQRKRFQTERKFATGSFVAGADYQVAGCKRNDEPQKLRKHGPWAFAVRSMPGIITLTLNLMLQGARMIICDCSGQMLHRSSMWPERGRPQFWRGDPTKNGWSTGQG